MPKVVDMSMDKTLTEKTPVQDSKVAPERQSTSSGTRIGRLSFLCPHHKDWVYFNSQEAILYLEKMQQKAEFLLENRKFQEALPFVGCAWESAAIILELQNGERTFLINRFASLTVLLNICFEQLGQSECALHARVQSVTLLSEISGQSDMTKESEDYLLQCIANLRNPELYKMFLMPWPANDYASTLH